MEGPRCVIKKCFAVKYGSRHCFPNPAKNMEMFKKWIKYCDDEIRSLPPENVYQNRRVCRNHFINDQFGSNNRLLSSAYPVLNIPMLSVPSAINNKITDNMTMQPTTFYNIEIEPSVGPSKESEMHIYASTPKRSGILADIDLTRQKDLTRKLYRKLNIEKRKTTALRRLTKSLKIRLRKADQYAKSKVFEKMYSKLGLIRTRFFESQLANANRASKGHRFSTKDKLFALALYKQTGRGYKFLSNIFDLPSKSTLTRLLQSIPVKPGLNTAILNVLNKKARYFKNPLEKYCILIFDEMSISPHLDFDQKEESIVGFESNGCQTSRLIANHVQVFMLQGIYRKWKQPVYYNFIKGASKSALIAKTIKEIIRAVENIGLQIIATVCDQATNNVAAINSLIDSTNYGCRKTNQQSHVFAVDDKEIVPLYDIPHLIKGIRNNFLKNNIKFEINGEVMTAKWAHIYTAWQIDSSLGNLRIMLKLTGAHIEKQQIKKMKVSYCTQTLSASVAAGINILALSETSINVGMEQIKMPAEGVHTAKFVKFCDNLFDSFNGSRKFSVDGKILKAAVSEKTSHIQFWTEAINILTSMRFVTDRGQTVPRPSLKKIIFTIKNFRHLYNNMQNLGFTYMLPRRFNQDGLENFFGRIRQCGMRYVNPTAFAFTPFYKSLLINNLTSKHPPGSNCEDDNTGILVTLEMLINQNQNEEAQTASQLFTVKKQQSRALSLTTVAYVVGFLMKKILPKYRSCGICKKNVCSSEEERTAIYHKLTQAKEYGAVAHKLQYISENLFIKMSHVYYVIRNILPDIIEKKNILTFLTQYCHENISFEFEQCNHTHSLIKNIIHGFTKIIVCNYIRHVNDILQGKDRRDIRKEADTIFHSAKEMYIKTKRH